MSRNKYTGEKTTATKPERRHSKAVDAEIRHSSPAAAERSKATFDHLHKTVNRYAAGGR